MSERLTPLSTIQNNLKRHLTHLPDIQPLSPNQHPPTPFAHLQRQQEIPNHLSLQNTPPDKRPNK